jgi:hypothetical protein
MAQEVGALGELLPTYPHRIARIDVILKTIWLMTATEYIDGIVGQFDADQPMAFIKGRLDLPIYELTPSRMRPTQYDCTRSAGEADFTDSSIDVLQVVAIECSPQGTVFDSFPVCRKDSLELIAIALIYGVVITQEDPPPRWLYQ